MKSSRTKFVVFFLASAFVFLFLSNMLYGSSVRLFPGPGEPWLGTESSVTWQIAAAAIFYPVKIILIGPMLPLIKFLSQEPDTPPPFFVAMFILYWSLLALVFHYLLSKIKHS